MDVTRSRRRLPAIAATFGVAAASFASGASTSQYVINISVDGLGSSYLNNYIAGHPTSNLATIVSQGAGTLNARNDYDYTVTLPNHTSMVTGRPVIGVSGNGHNWTTNTDPGGLTIQAVKGSYVASVFDVAHDNGLRTGVWAGKTKFSLYDTSYDATNGAPDTTGVNNGKDKVDTYTYNATLSTLVGSFTASMNSNPSNFAFVHMADPDSAGHTYGWGSTQYYTAVGTCDTALGSILTMIQNSPTLNGKTTIILTADHGGNGTDHSNNSDPLDYTIPFYVWGAGVTQGNLYAMNSSRQDPLTSRISFSATGQPVRNGDSANLALSLLGLGAVPGSSIDSAQNLVVPEPGSVALLGIPLGAMLLRRSRRAVAESA